MQTIFAISPINRIKVPVGNIDLRNRIATFYITEARFFKEAEAVGVDLNIFNRKAIQWCDYIQFNLWDDRRYKISRIDFEKNSWVYPPGSKPEYKARHSEFAPKLMVSLTRVKELNQRNKEKEDEEMLKEAMS